MLYLFLEILNWYHTKLFGTPFKLTNRSSIFGSVNMASFYDKILTYPMTNMLPMSKAIPYVWATNIAAMHTNMADPSLLNTTSRGKAKLATFSSTPNLLGNFLRRIGIPGALKDKIRCTHWCSLRCWCTGFMNECLHFSKCYISGLYYDIIKIMVKLSATNIFQYLMCKT